MSKSEFKQYDSQSVKHYPVPTGHNKIKIRHTQTGEDFNAGNNSDEHERERNSNNPYATHTANFDDTEKESEKSPKFYKTKSEKSLGSNHKSGKKSSRKNINTIIGNNSSPQSIHNFGENNEMTCSIQNEVTDSKKIIRRSIRPDHESANNMDDRRPRPGRFDEKSSFEDLDLESLNRQNVNIFSAKRSSPHNTSKKLTVPSHIQQVMSYTDSPDSVKRHLMRPPESPQQNRREDFIPKQFEFSPKRIDTFEGDTCNDSPFKVIGLGETDMEKNPTAGFNVQYTGNMTQSEVLDPSPQKRFIEDTTLTKHQSQFESNIQYDSKTIQRHHRHEQYKQTFAPYDGKKSIKGFASKKKTTLSPVVSTGGSNNQTPIGNKDIVFNTNKNTFKTSLEQHAIEPDIIIEDNLHINFNKSPTTADSKNNLQQNNFLSLHNAHIQHLKRKLPSDRNVNKRNTDH